ncbi:MAG: fibronectin type III domain-containing protein, partial [Terriglobales bacterium]
MLAMITTALLATGSAQAGTSARTRVLPQNGPFNNLTRETTKRPSQQSHPYFTTHTVTTPDGTKLEEHVIDGPPTPPPGYWLERSIVALPGPSLASGVNTLTVPAYEWSFGCSATSGAMIAAYDDRNGFPNIYTGPTNGGVMPLDSSSWPFWADGVGTQYAQCPLAASHSGLDGRAEGGSIDDYWVSYLSSAPDPYITGSWTQHTWGDAIGDYMKTSQSAYSNVDGSTSFWGYSDSTKLSCSAMEGFGITNDGTYGRQLFYLAKGYSVTDCYNQATDNQASGGFSFAQFEAEIDAGRPVMLNLNGHTIVGVGYDSSSNTVYLHDTWDYGTHTMTWGGNYAGMDLMSVSMVTINTAAPACYTFSTATNPAGSGSVTVNTPANCGGSYSAGTAISLTVNVPSGYIFAGWSGSGGVFSNPMSNPTTFWINHDTTLTASLFVAGAPGSERQALLDLYTSTGGPNWTNNANWGGAPGTECAWYGVTCNVDQTAVQQLDLDWNHLSGAIPSVIGSLISLQYLDLRENQLSGGLPTQLGSLVNLQHLDLSWNQLSGSIPTDLASLTGLQFLDLHANQLSGSIPAEIGSLTSLQHLDLSSNELSGSIPPELGNLTGLDTLTLQGNQLTGTVPTQLGSLTALTALDLSWNQLSGGIPTELGDLTGLQYLFMYHNQLNGSIPNGLGNLTALYALELQQNQLSGTIPTELGNLTGLQDLNLGFNQLSGSIPTQLWSLTGLQYLDLGGNQFGGSIPTQLGSLTELQYLSLAKNQFSGSIPVWLGSLPNLTTVFLSFNQLTGSIPPQLGNLCNLELLELNTNELVGPIPSELGSLTKLYWLDLGSNQLTGSIPTQLGSLANLQLLCLNSNQLVGAVPSSVTNLTKLVAGCLDFRWNGLYSADPTVVAFLNGKQFGGDWQSTQTVPVTGVGAGGATTSSVTLNWTPIAYTDDTGGYEVFYATTSGGPYTLSGTTADKLATSWPVTGLAAGTPYYFNVKSVTNPHANNQNTVVSEPSAEVLDPTLGPPAISSAPSTTFAIGSSNSFTLTTTGYPAPSIALSGSLPSAVSFTDNGNGTATLAGTPAAGTGDTYPLTITAHNGVGSDATQSFTLIVQNCSCYTLSTDTSPGGIGSVAVDTAPNCGGNYVSGTEVSLTANVPSGYAFGGWSGSGGTFSSTSANPTTFTITGNASVAATFTKGAKFFPLTPCRLVDSRHGPNDVKEPGNITPSGFPRGSYNDGDIRSYDL